MSDGLDRERIQQLIHGHLEHTLSEAERRELEALLHQHESVRRDLVIGAALNQELFALHESLPQEAAQRRPTRREIRRENATPWGLAFAAAAIFIALVLLFTSSSHENAPRAPVAEQKLRIDAERKLAEIEQRRVLLEQATSPAVENPEKKKVELSNLEEEKRKIEEDLKAAIAEARRLQEQKAPAPAPQPPGPVPVPPHVPTPAPPSPGATVVTALARIERVEGEGWVLRKEGRVPVREGMDLQSGESLETGAAGRLVVRFSDRTRLELRSETTVAELAEGPKRLLVARGSVAADVTKQPVGRPMVLRTPQAEATVLGTSLRILVEPGEKGASRLEVLEGKVRFSRTLEKKESVEVVTGHYAVAAAGSALASHPLPPERIGTASSPVVVSLTLLNADTGRPILQFAPLEDGRTITLADLPTRNLNIVATTSPPNVGCVIFSWDGTAMPEVNRPYLMAGNDAAAKPKSWTPAPGDHVLTATPFTGPANMARREGTGTAGSGLTLRLRVR